MPQGKMTPEQVAEYIKILQSDKMNKQELDEYRNLNPSNGQSDPTLDFVKQQIQGGRLAPKGLVKEIPQEFVSKESDRQKANAVMDQYRKPQSVLPQAPSQQDMDDSYNEFFGEEEKKPVLPSRFQNLKQSLK
jgi:hypothetical protein